VNIAKFRDAVAYWVQWVLLEVYGPASQDGDADPIRQLKKRYGRPTRSW
jgi:hypothetical protein